MREVFLLVALLGAIGLLLVGYVAAVFLAPLWVPFGLLLALCALAALAVMPRDRWAAARGAAAAVGLVLGSYALVEVAG